MRADMQPDESDTPTEIVCERSGFLARLLGDEERGRMATVEDYVLAFPSIEAFVRQEYAAMLSPAAVSEATIVCGRYRIDSVLARGGMGTVYAGFDPKLGRRVVIKTLQPALLRDPEARERLRREARVLGSLDHPHLLKITDVVEQGEELFLVMPLHEGHTLAQRLNAARAASESGAGAAYLCLTEQARERAACMREVLGYFRQVAEALHTAHLADIVHRDVKPENLLVNAAAQPVVIDFGLAVASDTERLTAAGELIGTPLYMPPELVEGRAATSQSDVYSLGVCLYEALTLRQPFSGAANRQATFHRIQAGDVVPPRRHVPLVSRDLEAVVLRAMDRDPARRYASAQALADELQRVLDLQPTEARPVSGMTQTWRRIRRRPWFSVACLASMVLVVALGWAVVRYAQLRGAAMRYLDDPNERNAASLHEYRSLIEQGGEGIVLLYPRGKVSRLDRLEWLGDEPKDGDVLLHNRYRVQVFDAAGKTVWSGEHVQSQDSRWCAVQIPTLPFDAGVGGRWQVEWIGDGLGTEQESDFRETCDASPWYYLAATSFDVQPAELAPTSSLLNAQQLRDLLNAGYASEVLSALSRLPAVGAGVMPLPEHAALQRDAAGRLGLTELRTAAVRMLEEIARARR